MMIVVGVIIIGGIKRIASVTEKVVPFMAGIYVLACLYIIFSNFSYIDDAFGLIFSQAFTPPAAVGGFIGVLIQGFRRVLFLMKLEQVLPLLHIQLLSLAIQPPKDLWLC